MISRRWLAWLAILATCPAAAPAADPPKEPPPAVPVTRKAVDERIAADIEYLWKALGKGSHWAEPIKKVPDENSPRSAFEVYNVGGSAMALLALKVAGVDEQDERFQRCLAWLNEQQWHGVYFRGLRATLYGQLKDPKYRALLHADGEFLLKCCRPSGMFSYYTAESPAMNSVVGDFSNTQYGLLGIWSAADRGFEVPSKFWKLVENAYLVSIGRDGGFSYHWGAAGPKGREDGHGAMTAAALASMFVIWEKEYTLNDKDCSGKVNPDLLKAIDGGLAWMARNFASDCVPTGQNCQYKEFLKAYPFYYFYSLERVGVASGLKYFGRHDWYKEVTFSILNGKARPSGVNDRSWELMFLAYGRAPVAFNKLQYGRGWNEHPREYPMLCRFLSKTYEKHHNWQIMPVDAPVQEFHDAPILAMSGKKEFKLKPEESAKIKAFLLQGGTLFGEAIDNAPGFVNSMRALCLEMFPNLEMVRLGPEHPIYSSHFKLAKGEPELLGLSDGVRTLVIVSPKEISCDWQRANVVTGRQNFELGANLLQYACEHDQLWSKEESYWPIDAGNKASRTIQVGRLIHGEAKAEHVWNPTGGTGWQRLDIVSRNGGGAGIATAAVDLAKPLDAAKTPLLHVTGIGPILLNDQAKANLKTYVQSGGLLLADAAGGKPAFAESFTKLMAELFPDRRLLPPPADAVPFVAQASERPEGKEDGDAAGGRIWYRHWQNMPKSLRPLELLAVHVPQKDGSDRWAALFLPCDLSYALNGAPTSEPVGLAPASAERLMFALLAWRTGATFPMSASSIGEPATTRPDD